MAIERAAGTVEGIGRIRRGACAEAVNSGLAAFGVGEGSGESEQDECHDQDAAHLVTILRIISPRRYLSH